MHSDDCAVKEGHGAALAELVGGGDAEEALERLIPCDLLLLYVPVKTRRVTRVNQSKVSATAAQVCTRPRAASAHQVFLVNSVRFKFPSVVTVGHVAAERARVAARAASMLDCWWRAIENCRSANQQPGCGPHAPCWAWVVG